jgi:hypothetical protein
MLRITSPERADHRIGSVTFRNGGAQVESVSSTERLFFDTRGYTVTEIEEPTPDGDPDADSADDEADGSDS